jgi:hypothetical protein
MKCLLFSIVICFSFLFFSNSSFGQKPNDTAYYDFDLEDFVIHFDVSNQNANILIPPAIYFPQNVDQHGRTQGYLGEFRDGKIYLSHPSSIMIEGEGNYCYAIFYDIFFRKIQTQNITIEPPPFKCDVSWTILESRVLAEATIEGIGDLIPTAQYFTLINPKTNEKLQNMNAQYSNLYFKAIRDYGDLDPTIPVKIYLDFNLELIDSRGVLRFRETFGSKTLILFKKSEFTVKNIVSRGSFVPHWDSYNSENAQIFNLQGQCIYDFIAHSGEHYYFPEGTPTGYYVLRIGDMQRKKIFKYNN